MGGEIALTPTGLSASAGRRRWRTANPLPRSPVVGDDSNIGGVQRVDQAVFAGGAHVVPRTRQRR